MAVGYVWAGAEAALAPAGDVGRCGSQAGRRDPVHKGVLEEQ
jgi:hypothetical protein